mmetsp:Transcript_23605/g.46142  ORF Transcript_23605/g.46142 Transcript_23605/m.46142 type:complete len:230 (-) Transcript_23605:239-928(-)
MQGSVSRWRSRLRGAFPSKSTRRWAARSPRRRRGPRPPTPPSSSDLRSFPRTAPTSSIATSSSLTATRAKPGGRSSSRASRRAADPSTTSNSSSSTAAASPPSAALPAWRVWLSACGNGRSRSLANLPSKTSSRGRARKPCVPRSRLRSRRWRRRRGSSRPRSSSGPSGDVDAAPRGWPSSAESSPRASSSGTWRRPRAAGRSRLSSTWTCSSTASTSPPRSRPSSRAT